MQLQSAAAHSLRPDHYPDWQIKPCHIGCAFRKSFQVRTSLRERDRILAECDIRLGLREAGWLRFTIHQSAFDPDLYTVTRTL